jgi:5'-nucleotidase (lipoprotein e(P4) family)
MRSRLLSSLTIAFILLTGCATAPVVDAPVAPVVAPATTTPAPHENLNSVIWTQTAVEYDALALQAYTAARQRLDEALADRNWTAAPDEQQGAFADLPPAVILDVDETVLDNSGYQAEVTWGHREFDPAEWSRWVDAAIARPIPGAVEFTQYAAGKGVAVFYVTNRTEAEKNGTARNLRSAGFPLDEGRLRTIPATDPNDRAATAAAREKANRRRDIARTHRILLLVGDDLGDFIAGAKVGVAERDALVSDRTAMWGRQWIMLPNPQYGSWEGALTSDMNRPTREQKVERKFRLLRRWK